jgi:hypothetical protein
MAKAYIPLYYDFIERTEALTEAERWRLIAAMLEYARSGQVQEDALTGNERFLFPVFRCQIDMEARAYDTRVQQNAANAKKGGRPRKRKAEEIQPSGFSETEGDEKNPIGFSKTEKTQEEEKEEEEEKDKEKEKDEDEEKQEERGSTRACAPHAPSLDAVVDFCRENRLRTNPHAFWHYYQSIGWLAGRHPIRDWQAKLREWEARGDVSAPFRADTPRAAPSNPALDYAQREYRDEDYGDDFFIDVVREYGKGGDKA